MPSSGEIMKSGTEILQSCLYPHLHFISYISFIFHYTFRTTCADLSPEMYQHERHTPVQSSKAKRVPQPTMTAYVLIVMHLEAETDMDSASISLLTSRLSVDS